MALTTTQRTDLIKVYLAAFNRAPDASGLDFWARSINDGTHASVIAVADAWFADSTLSEVVAAYPAYLSNEEFVGRIYTNVFGRTADAEGLAFWANSITNGVNTKGSVLVNMFASLSNAGSEADKAVFDNKVAVSEYFAVTVGSNDVALAASVVANVDGTAASVTAANASIDSSANTGSTFTLTTGVDSITGTAKNDSISALDTTLTALDTIDGGAGTDSLSIADSSNTAFTLSNLYTISNVETLALSHVSNGAADIITLDVTANSALETIAVSNTGTAITDAAGGVNIDTSANVQTVTIDGGATAQDIDNINIADAGTATTDALSTVTLTGLLNGTVAGNAIASDALTTLNLNAVVGVVTNTDSSTTDSRALTVNFNGGTNGGVTDAGAKTTNVNVNAATTAMGTVTTVAATTLNVDVNAALTAGTIAAAAATDVNVNLDAAITAMTLTTGAGTAVDFTGTANATVTQTAAAAAVITNGGSGNLTLNTAIGTGQTYVGGSGVDTVTFAAAGTKASSLGAGDDVATFSAAAAAGGSVDGGDGTDTVSLTAANAVTVSANDTFEGDIANFEKVSIGAYAASTGLANADDSTISLANLDSINYVTLAGAGAAANAQIYTISGFATGGTFAQTGALSDADVTVALTGSFTGATDVMNLAVSGTNGFVNTGVLTLASVETVNITTNDTDTTAATTMFDLNLDATSATTINLSGDAGMTFANGSFTALRTLDASGVTATGAAGVVTATANAGLDTTLIGGAGNDVLTGNTAADTLTGGAGTDTLGGAAGADTINGGDGVDTITGGTGADTLTGGAGNDIFVFADADSTTAAADSITDFAAGDVIRLAAADNVAGASTTPGTVATTNVQVSAGGKVTFAAADDTLAEMLVALAADTTDIATNEVVFFELGSDTYVFNNVGGTDDLVKLTGVTGFTTLTESTTTAGDFTLA